MWNTKIFKTREAFNNWVDRYGHRNQWQEIFINSAYGVEFKPFRRVY